MVNGRTVGEWGGERADSLIMEAAAAAASLSPLFNAVDSCHHDLHDVITCCMRPWYGPPRAEGGYIQSRNVVPCGNLPAWGSYEISRPCDIPETAMNSILLGGKNKKKNPSCLIALCNWRCSRKAEKFTKYLLSSRITDQVSKPS